jgi:hypothetical protein
MTLRPQSTDNFCNGVSRRIPKRKLTHEGNVEKKYNEEFICSHLCSVGVNRPCLTPPVISLLALFSLTIVGRDLGQPALPEPLL